MTFSQKQEEININKTEHYLRVEKLMNLCGQETPQLPTIPGQDTLRLRANLIFEEALEAIEALGFYVKIDKNIKVGELFDDIRGFLEPIPNANIDLAAISKELADVSVVSIGSLVALGISDKPILEAVDNNNLGKFGPGSYKRSDGKHMKPEGYPKPDLKSIIENQK